MFGPARSVDKTGSGAVKAAPGQLVSAVLTAGSDAATLILQDDPDSADGNVIVKLSAVANTSAIFSPAAAVSFSKGCYASITGTSPNVTVVIL